MPIGSMQLKPIDANVVLKDKVYGALKAAITSMDLYAADAVTKLDERRLADELGVSRTPIREALSRLEQEGLVQMVPRRGAFVVRKTKRQILEIICVWGALESLAARLATLRAGDDEIAGLRRMFVDGGTPRLASACIDEYSQENISFHQTIIRLGKCELLSQIADGLFLHMHAIRARSNRERNQGSTSVVDHLQIIEALERRDADLADRLIREHTSRLAAHVEQTLTWVD